MLLFQNCSTGFQTEESPSESNPIKNEDSNLPGNQSFGTSCQVENGTGEFSANTGKCLTKSCNVGFHIDSITSSCISNQLTCPISNGSGQKNWLNGTWSTCQLISCNNNFHKDSLSNTCVPNTRDCSINGQNGNQTWNGTNWTECIASACPMGKHMENNSCVSNTKSCMINNGSGEQTWSGVNWGICEVTTCNTNFHSDNTNSNCLPNTQACQNSFGNGSQTWNGANWGQCQMQSCIGGFHIESSSCISDNKNCSLNGRNGSQTWTGSGWTTCLTCTEAYTPLFNKCEPNYQLVKNYSSFFTSCWNDGVFICPIIAPTGYIGVPDKFYGDATTTFQFSINYSGVSEILLNSSHINLTGSGATGCQKSILPNGENSKIVSIFGCSGNGPVNFTISANSAKNTSGNMAGAFGPSTHIIIKNTLPSVVYTKLANLEYSGEKTKQIFDFYYPNDYSSKSNIPIFIWIHGGGWSGGDKNADSDLAEKVAALGFFVINANYTLAPTYVTPYPQLTLPVSPYITGQNDINELVKYVKTAILQYNGDINKITISGGSAGGHIALYQATRSDNTTQFKCVISAAGPTDLVAGNRNDTYPVTKFIINYVFGISEAVLINSSPALQVQNLKTSKLLLLHQLQDNLVPIDHSLRMAAQVTALKPGVSLFRAYLSDTNNFPVFSPTPEQITHIENLNVKDSIASFVNQECK